MTIAGELPLFRPYFSPFRIIFGLLLGYQNTTETDILINQMGGLIKFLYQIVFSQTPRPPRSRLRKNCADVAES